MTPAAVAVGVVVVPSMYAFEVVPKVTLTLVSLAAIVTWLKLSPFLFFKVKVLPDKVKLLAYVVKIGLPLASPVALAAKVAVAALPVKSPAKVGAVNVSSVTYTLLLEYVCAEAAWLLAPTRYNLLVSLVEPAVFFVSCVVTVLNVSPFLFLRVKVVPEPLKLLA